MHNNSEKRAHEFLVDHEYVAPEDLVTPEFILNLHFEGALDHYVETIQRMAIKLRRMDTKSNALEIANRLIPGLVFAGHHSIFLSHHVLKKFAEHDPDTFLAMLEHAMADEATRRNLATMLRSGVDDSAIQALIDHHRPISEGRVIESVERPSDHAVAERFENDFNFRLKVIEKVDLSDPELMDRIFADLRSGKFRANDETVENAPKAEIDFNAEEFEGGRRKLTVTEARRRVMAHTGQSERAVIRQTKGWAADEIIRLVA